MSDPAELSAALDTPADLLVRWGVLAAAYASIGVDDVASLTADTAIFDDRWWCAAAAATSVGSDGHTAAADAVLHDDRTLAELAELAELVVGWNRPDTTPAPPPHAIAAAAAALLDDARAATLDRERLYAFAALGRPVTPDDLARGLASATAAGLTPGSRSPLEPALQPVTPRPPRRRRRWSEAEHERRVWAALRAATETPRPAPAAGREITRLVDWLRRQGHLHPDHPGISLQLCAGSATSDGLGPITFDEWADLATLAARMRNAGAHPEHGRWIWLHITLARTPSRNPLSRGQVRLTRAYDHLPDWWPGPPDGLFLEDLRTEMRQRAPSWRPPWTVLLDPDAAWETQAPG